MPPHRGLVGMAKARRARAASSSGRSPSSSRSRSPLLEPAARGFLAGSILIACGSTAWLLDEFHITHRVLPWQLSFSGSSGTVSWLYQAVLFSGYPICGLGVQPKNSHAVRQLMGIWSGSAAILSLLFFMVTLWGVLTWQAGMTRPYDVPLRAPLFFGISMISAAAVLRLRRGLRTIQSAKLLLAYGLASCHEAAMQLTAILLVSLAVRLRFDDEYAVSVPNLLVPFMPALLMLVAAPQRRARISRWLQGLGWPLSMCGGWQRACRVRQSSLTPAAHAADAVRDVASSADGVSTGALSPTLPVQSSAVGAAGAPAGAPAELPETGAWEMSSTAPADKLCCTAMEEPLSTERQVASSLGTSATPAELEAQFSCWLHAELGLFDIALLALLTLWSTVEAWLLRLHPIKVPPTPLPARPCCACACTCAGGRGRGRGRGRVRVHVRVHVHVRVIGCALRTALAPHPSPSFRLGIAISVWPVCRDGCAPTHPP